MPIIDVQVHAYERNHPGRPWVGHLAGPEHVTGDEMVAAMDAVGVDGAILVSPFALYRFDASYALDVYAAHPGRFGLVKPVDTADPGVADTVAAWAATKGAVGIRIMLNQTPSADPADPGINRVLAAAAQHSLPVNMLVWGRLDGAVAVLGPGPVNVADCLKRPICAALSRRSELRRARCCSSQSSIGASQAGSQSRTSGQHTFRCSAWRGLAGYRFHSSAGAASEQASLRSFS